jgi:hypothetical protein
LATYLPGTGRLVCASTGETSSARYCYSVWMRHLVLARAAGWDGRLRRVAEVGPGGTLGTVLAALLTGAETAHAFDAKAYARREADLAVFEGLVDLFRRRAPIPADGECAAIHPLLDDWRFPEAMLGGALVENLRPERLAAIRAALVSRSGRAGGITVGYTAPWEKRAVPLDDRVDLIFSQAVMEHVDAAGEAYRAMRGWLAAGGWMSHTIDYRSHGYTRDWNGHWTVPDALWRVVRGRRPYFINRLPHSAHLRLLAEAGFEVVRVLTTPGETLPRRLLAPSFAGITGEDLATAGAFIQARPAGRGDPGGAPSAPRAEPAR